MILKSFIKVLCFNFDVSTKAFLQIHAMGFEVEHKL